MLSRLLYLIFVVLLGWLIGRLFGAARRGSVRPGRDSRRVSDQGAMVRDRVCNTFLPRSRAVVARLGDEDHFFCSERCRRRFLERAGTAGSTPDPGSL